jgi:very-short-patch-repair endonuclease
MGDKYAPLDMEISKIARRQHGVISHPQLLALGMSRNAVSARARRGGLHRVHQGVYGVGYRPVSPEALWMAAVLACGTGATLSHGSAAALWGFLKPIAGPIDVSVPTRSGRGRRTGIRVHRCASLSPERVTWRRDVPVTTPARTIEDLEGMLPPWLVRRARRQAEISGLRLGAEIATDRTRSDLEWDFLRLCRRHGLPAPEVNVKVGRRTVDFLWRRQGIAVETDFFGYHRGRVAFRDDRARDLELRRHGFAVHRFSEEQVNEQPEEVAADLRDALGLAS